jgi:hypothetical protein
MVNSRVWFVGAFIKQVNLIVPFYVIIILVSPLSIYLYTAANAHMNFIDYTLNDSLNFFEFKDKEFFEF